MFNYDRTGGPESEKDRAPCVGASSRMERFIVPCLLLLVSEKPGHGYDLTVRLEEFGFCDIQDTGQVYRHLRRLEEQGKIVSEWDTSGTGPAKRWYSITEPGRELVREWRQAITSNIAALKLFLDRSANV